MAVSSIVRVLKCTCCGQYDEELVGGLCAYCESLSPSHVDPNAEYFDAFRKYEDYVGYDHWEFALGSRDDLDDTTCDHNCTCPRCRSYNISDHMWWGD